MGGFDIGGQVQFPVAGGVTQGTVRHQPTRTTGNQPGRQNVAEGGGAGVATRVDHQNIIWPHAFDGDALDILAVVIEFIDQIFAHGNIAQREGIAHQSQIGAQWV